jgi:hypothetical protein
MTTQNYLIIENNVVTNVVVWDGNTQDWQPPSDATMLIQATTPATVWVANNANPPVYTLTLIIGAGDIGFTWNGTVLTTNQTKPSINKTT